DCHAPLSLTGADDNRPFEVSCSLCSISYRTIEGIINFGVRDVFYDHHGFTSTGRDFSDGLLGRVGLYLARSHFLYDISRSVARGSGVIEIGSGGGSRYLASRYDMLGVELSSASVRCVANPYGSAVQATVAGLPLADHCADALVSSFLLEHLGPEIVETCIS